MAVLLITEPHTLIYTRTLLHAIGRAENDAELRYNLRLIAAILFAHWSDTVPDLSGIRGQIFDVMTDQFFYQNGYAKTKSGNDERIWLCSYIGFEKITSAWAKKHHPGCRGYICVRLCNRDTRHELDSHTIILYY